MKRIVLFINTLSSGGAEHQMCELADGLVEHGYDVTIATFGDTVDHYPYSPFVKRHHIAPGKSSMIKLLAIWKYFLTLETDCVIAFCQRNIRFCMEALQFRSRKNIRIIASERNFTIGEPSNHERALMNRLYRRVDYIVCNNHAQNKHIVELKPEYRGKTITIINYTDLSLYQQSPLPVCDIIRIGVFGRYDIQKNCLRFVEAMKILHEKSKRKFIVDWYGNQSSKDGKLNSCYIEMKSKVKEYGLQDCIILHDHIKNVAEMMPQFDAISLPSLWEGFSNSISEAICCGKPCLVSDISDNGYMVRNGENGFLFDPTKEMEIANAFLRFFSLSVKERQCMGDVSRKRAEELFDKERFINAYIELIESS